jgi:hypothetical protein
MLNNSLPFIPKSQVQVIALVLENLDLSAQFRLLDQLRLVDRVRERAFDNTTVVPGASVAWLA